MKNLGDDGLKIANIIGNDVEYVTKRVVTGVLNKKMKVNIMSNAMLIWRFSTSPFRKKQKK